MKEDYKVILALIKRDFKCGFRNNCRKYMVALSFWIVINIVYINKLCTTQNVNSYQFFFELFKGVPYQININTFSVPVIWILANCSIIFIIGSYLSDDLKNNGVYLITRCGKLRFFLSKILWVISNIGIYYIIIFGISIVISNLFLDSKSNIIIYEGISMKGIYSIVYIIILYISTAIMLGIFYVIFGIIVEAKYSFLLVIVILVLSIFIKSNLMPGQHSLLLRHVPFDKVYDLTSLKSIIYNIILTVAFLFIGSKIIDKIDIF